MSNKPKDILLESFEQLKLIEESVARSEEIEKTKPAPVIRELKLADLPEEVLREIAQHVPYTWHSFLRRTCRRLHDAVPRKPFPTIVEWIMLNHDGWNPNGHSRIHTWATCPCCLEKPPKNCCDPPDWIPNFLPYAGIYFGGRNRTNKCRPSCVEWFCEDGTLVHDGPRSCGLETQPRPEVRWRPICLGCVWRLQGLLD